MTKMYNVVHVKPDKTEELIDTAAKPSDLAYLLEAPKYSGTWIDSNRKILRNNRGEIQIREIHKHAVVDDFMRLVTDRHRYLQASIIGHDTIRFLKISNSGCTAYNNLNEVIWFAKNFTELAEMISKEVAYECMMEFDKMIEEHQLQSVI